MIIYKTKNLINGKIYIGKDEKNVANYLGSGKYFKRALKKYGKENFRKTIIDIAEDSTTLCLKEIFWIDFYNARDGNIGYNIQPGGEGSHLLGEKHPMFGKHLLDETKRKLSESHKGKKIWNKGLKTGRMSEEQRRNISLSLKGRKQSMESIEKRIESRKDYSHSEETRLKISRSVVKLWQSRCKLQLQAGGY